ncbi:hypothetical protein [Xenorhabdus bovienii]|nr:hypothetical protein [Xenorhabdus bovienii]MDE9542945.1 hypothetical protein [Xenorhabdus bovienii]
MHFEIFQQRANIAQLVWAAGGRSAGAGVDWRLQKPLRSENEQPLKKE